MVVRHKTAHINLLVRSSKKRQNSRNKHVFTKFTEWQILKTREGVTQSKHLWFSVQPTTALRCILWSSPYKVTLKDRIGNPWDKQNFSNIFISFSFPLFWKPFQSQWVFVAEEIAYLLSTAGDGHHPLHLFIALCILHKTRACLACLNVSNCSGLPCIFRIRLLPGLDSSAAFI